MNSKSPHVPSADAAKAWLREAIRVQEIEGNPLDREQIAMFEMFDREGWSQERCLEYLRERARKKAASPNAAE